ncbi:acyl-CoA-binding domain-containing protein 5 isoform X1 [Dermacentor silvarum]|uniref:acyl-CoA-binding domain-containing protein 5 isoform X1 n=1 Tax=Dermacentor silvarum TaxID=543639 RepID=UPI00189AB5F1|nr:acyl-CoA-binding domain-containing protein 5 isoform X1 [Dermacentor silvarum]
MTTEERFNAAVEVIRGLPKNGSFQPSHELQLKFYAYYKQATLGSVAECKVPKPRFWDIVGNAKWDAWMKLGDMSKQEAMEKYVDELVKVVKKCQENATEEQIVEAMSYTDHVAKFVDLLGPLFDSVPPQMAAVLPQAKVNGNRDSEDDIETIEAPEQKQPLYSKADKKQSDEKPERKAAGGMNGHGSDFESDEDEFSDTYDHMGDEDESGSPEPREREASGMVATAVNEALMNGSDRVLVQDSKSQLWAFYPDGSKQPNGELAFVRGGGDDNPHRGAPLPRSGPGAGRLPRSHRRREADGGAEGPAWPSRSAGRLPGATGGMGGGGGSGGRPQLALEVSEQLAVAVLRLQQTMDEVVARLEVLETLLQHAKAPQSQRWWLFGGVAPHVLVLLFAWPVVFQLAFYIFSHRRRRHLR